MKAVWKFEIATAGLNEISMPFGSQPLVVQERDGKAQLWCLCDTEMKVYEVRRFRFLRTGDAVPETNIVYIGTAQVSEGEFIYHLFEVRP